MLQKLPPLRFVVQLGPVGPTMGELEIPRVPRVSEFTDDHWAHLERCLRDTFAATTPSEAPATQPGRTAEDGADVAAAGRSNGLRGSRPDDEQASPASTQDTESQDEGVAGEGDGAAVELDESERSVLEEMAGEQYASTLPSTTEFRRQRGLTNREGEKLCNALEEKGLIFAFRMRTEHGGTKKVWYPTRRGFRAVGRVGESLHRRLQEICASRLVSARRTSSEDTINRPGEAQLWASSAANSARQRSGRNCSSSPTGVSPMRASTSRRYRHPPSSTFTSILRRMADGSDSSGTIRAFRAIADALAAGDIALAGRILWLTLRKQWLKGTKQLRDRWTDFKHEFLRLSADAWFGSLRLLARALFHIEQAWANTRSFFANLWKDVRGDATETWNAVVYLGRRAAAHTKAAFDETMDLDARLREIDQQFLYAQHGEQRRRRQQEREIARERDRRIEQAERDLEGTLDVLLQQHADRLSDIDQAHERELDDTARAIEDARREWQKAIEDARRARESVGEDVDAPDGLRGPREFLKDFEGIIGNLRDVAERTIQVRGTFSAAALHGMGVAGDAEQRTAQATEQTARNTKRLLDEARAGGLAFS